MDSMQASQNKFLASLVAVFIVGGIVGVAVDPYLPSAVSNAKKGYQTGFTAARKLVEESRFGSFFKMPDDMRTLSGTVTSIENDKVGIHLTSTNPFDDQILNDRTVVITADTKILKIVGKDSKVLQAELAKFDSTPTATPPLPYTQSVGSIGDIKVGQTLTVTTLENVKTEA